MEIERKKYIDLYEDKNNIYKKNNDSRGYGAGNNGSSILDYMINNLSFKNVCDVGTGQGHFCVDLANKSDVECVWGVDFASVKTNKVIKHDKVVYLDNEAHQIDLPDNSVDYLTSFDCLEHCVEEEVDKVLDEFNRIAVKGWVLRIAYRQAYEKSLNNENLHMTVRPEEWWVKKIKRYGNVEKIKRYLIMHK